jgi:hypothetical protein
MRPKVVFCGPTLSQTEALETLDAIYLPPAVQGSIVWAVQQFDPAAILVVDGGFQSEPAVRHKEILWAIGRGIPVVGVASMGALRAAELYPYMQGAGLIYRWYRRFDCLPDDAVAVLHGPAEVNFVALTQALIDLRMTVRAACRRGAISGELRAKLESAAQNLNFRDRTVARMLSDALPHEDESVLRNYDAILAAAFVHQKKLDALQGLRLLRDEDYRSVPLTNLPMTSAFTRDLDDAGLAI